jgi:hypothetical protein
VSNVDVNTAGSYTVTYYVTDSGGLSASAVRTVVVAAAANALPTISLVGASSLSLSYGGPYIEYGATASDPEDGDLTSSIVITSNVNVNVVGSYTVTYQVTDSGGASASVTRTVTVAAYYNNPPTIALVGSSSLSLPFGGPYAEYGATATDTEDGNITANIVTHIQRQRQRGRQLYCHLSDHRQWGCQCLCGALALPLLRQRRLATSSALPDSPPMPEPMRRHGTSRVP